MIFINGKEVSFKTENGRYEEEAQKILKQIRDLNLEKRPYIIKFPDKYDKKDPFAENMGHPYRKAGYSIPLTETLSDWRDDGISTTITYCDRVKTDKDGNVKYMLKNGKTRYQFTGNATLYKQDSELAWFLHYISTYKGKAFVEIDRESNAKNIATENRRKFNTGKLVYDEMSEQDVRTVTKSLQIAGVDEMVEDEVRNVLFEKIMTDSALYRDFVENKKVDDSVENQALLQTARDKGVLRLEIKGHQRTWYINLGSGEQELKKIKPGMNPDNVLKTYFNDNPEMIEEIRKLITKL